MVSSLLCNRHFSQSKFILVVNLTITLYCYCLSCLVRVREETNDGAFYSAISAMVVTLVL